MPLTRRDLVARIARRDAAGGGELDLRGEDLTGADLSAMELDRVVFGRGREGRDAARLQGADLRGATLRGCSLTRCDLRDVDLRGAVLEDCDLRYVTTQRTNLGDVVMRRCDLYRASFDAGTIFSPRALEHVSLTNAWLSGMSAFNRGSLSESSLVQEDEAAYRAFLRPTAEESPESINERVHRRHLEAAAVYRGLSGLWASQGLLGDSGWAYARSRALERREASPLHRATPARWARWLGLVAVDVVSGYGLRIGRVAACLALLSVLPGVVYALAGGVRNDARTTHRLGDSLLFSLGQLTSSTPERLTAAHRWVEWASVVQTLLGVTLLGLLGFVLGAVIRSS